jgi:hypothetical protein
LQPEPHYKNKPPQKRLVIRFRTANSTRIFQKYLESTEFHSIITWLPFSCIIIVQWRRAQRTIIANFQSRFPLHLLMWLRNCGDFSLRGCKRLPEWSHGLELYFWRIKMGFSLRMIKEFFKSKNPLDLLVYIPWHLIYKNR